MSTYQASDLLRLAKRHHNVKRTYLLVDPLQGKHIPVSPGRALAMLRELGGAMAAAEPGIDLVIGFAETATAVAAAAAEGMGRPCRYVHTTREGFVSGPAVEFREEHSHAVEQRLSLARLAGWIDGARAVAFVDDELSTGRTLMNVIDQLAAACPALREKPIVAASIISRLDGAHRAALAEHGVHSCVSLLHLPLEDYTEAVRGYDIVGAEPPSGPRLPVPEIALPPSTGDARLGVDLMPWLDALRASAKDLLDALRPRLAGKRVTVLGTEEYMLPGLVLGEALEREGVAKRVRFHATTRSPIGICGAEGYPIQSGWRLHSFYDRERTTFIYDLEPCDAAVILTDSPDGEASALAAADLAAALRERGCGDVILLREACHVQHL